MSGPLVRVGAWACGACSRLHHKEADAAKCCLCKCGANVQKDPRFSYSTQCERCSLNAAIAHTRSNIKRAKETLNDQRPHLEKLVRMRDALPSPVRKS